MVFPYHLISPVSVGHGNPVACRQVLGTVERTEQTSSCGYQATSAAKSLRITGCSILDNGIIWNTMDSEIIWNGMIGHIHTEIGLDEYFAIFPYDGMSNHDFLASGILQSKFNFHGWLYFDNSQSRLNINGRSSMWFWLNCIICGLGQPACYNLLRSQNDMKGTAEILGDRAAQVKIKMHPGKWWSFRFPGSQAHFIPMKSHVFRKFAI